MSSNGSSTPNASSPCSDWYVAMSKNVQFASFFIIIPICAVVHIACHLTCLYAFYIETKKESAYLYQVFLTIGRIGQAFIALLCFPAFSLWSFVWSPGPDWFRSCYTCMWILGRLGNFLMITTYTLCEMLTLLTSANRFYAVWKPLSYRNCNLNVTLKKTLVILCTTIPILVNFPQIFRQYPQAVMGPSNDTVLYQIAPNLPFIMSNIGKFVILFKNIWDGLILLALYLCNFGMVWFFRVRRLEAKKGVHSDQQIKQRQKAEKALFLISIFQSTFITAQVTYRLGFFTWVYFDPTFPPCRALLHSVLVPLLSAIMDAADFFCLLVISKQFRKMVRGAMCKQQANSSIGTLVRVRPAGNG